MENELRKLDSPWWNGKICLENSERMAENVKGLDQSVKEMLLLIEHDGDFSVENPRSNHPLQPELIACIKEISYRHHLLVDHYNKLTEELKNYEKTTFSPQLTHPFLTPGKKLGMQNDEGQVVPSELSLSSGGGNSDTTPIEGSESSLLSSDSDSESYNSSPSAKMLKHEITNLETGISEMGRILDYEKEFNVCKEKLQFAEEEIAGLKSQLENNEAIIVKMGSIEAQLLSAQNQIKLHDAEIGEENKRSLMLQRQIVDLEAKLEVEKRRVQELEESIKNYTGQLSDRVLEIEKLNAELQDASANFALEKWQLESSVFKLEKQCELFEAEKVEMVRKQEVLKANWQDNIEQVKVELREKNVMVGILNENLDKQKVNYNMVMAEKDGVNAKLQTLSADLSVRDDQILCLQRNVHELRSENKRLSEGSDSANKVIAELKSRIDELEEEVGKQKVMISDTAEEKREAIRQLCFSLDHFRSAYQELRDVYAIGKRPTAMVL